MPEPADGSLVGRSRLARELALLGIRPGAVLMLHARMSALGWVVGGSGTIVLTLLDLLGENGTLMAYAGWEDDTYEIDAWAPERRCLYETDLPPFDPATAEAVHDHGRLPERIRTWPGAHRSRHPEAGIVAIGARAAWVTVDHPWDDSYGAGSPLAKLVEADGQVLMLGAPLDTITLLHHAEATARVAEKRRVVYRMPLLEAGRVGWRTFHDINTSTGAFPYEEIQDEIGRTPGFAASDDPFEVIARQALAAGIGRSGQTGQAESYLFPARELHHFAESWLERHFGAATTDREK